MLATVLLCVLSTLTFCLCARGLVSVTFGARGVPSVLNRRGFSVRAWRLARAYLVFAFFVLAIVSLAGAVVSYFDLFAADGADSHVRVLFFSNAG